MYKKLLFLIIALPFVHSTTYSSQSENYTIDNKTLKPSAFMDAYESCMKTAACGIMVATPILLSKESSVAKEAVLPLVAAIIVSSGISGTTNFITRVASNITNKTSWSKLNKIFSGINFLSIAIGSAAGLCFYHEKGYLFK